MRRSYEGHKYDTRASCIEEMNVPALFGVGEDLRVLERRHSTAARNI